MKKLVCILLVVTTVLSLCFAVSAAESDVGFSIEGTNGRAGDTVTVLVNLTKNPGIWAAKFIVNFDASQLELVSVNNGDVFSASEFQQGVINQSGKYVYYAQSDSYTKNVTATGTVLSLTFTVLDTAADTNSVYLTFPDNGAGWFFSAFDTETDYTVPADGEVSAEIKKLPLGDINGDTKVNASDCNLLISIILGKEGDEVMNKRADVDGDTKINASDCNVLKSIIIGKY